MRTRIVTGLIAAFALTVVSTAEAFFIIDTGTPTGSGGLGIQRFLDGAYGFVAGQFTTGQDYVLNSFEGYFGYTVFTPDGLVDAVLYGDDAGLPDVSDELFRQSFTIPGTFTIPPEQAWLGVFNINTSLQSGTYWLAFEPPAGQEVAAHMVAGAPNPLSLYAHNNNTIGQYTAPAASANFGFRIDASLPSTNAVPEPASMMLVSAGLAGFGLIRRRS